MFFIKRAVCVCFVLRKFNSYQCITALWLVPYFSACWQRDVCEQLVRGRYVPSEQPSVEATISSLQLRHSDNYTTEPYKSGADVCSSELTRLKWGVILTDRHCRRRTCYVHDRLDYCNALVGTSAGNRKAAISGTWRGNHFTQILLSLCWLGAAEDGFQDHNPCSLCGKLKCIHSVAPAYLQELCLLVENVLDRSQLSADRLDASTCSEYRYQLTSLFFFFRFPPGSQYGTVRRRLKTPINSAAVVPLWCFAILAPYKYFIFHLSYSCLFLFCLLVLPYYMVNKDEYKWPNVLTEMANIRVLPVWTVEWEARNRFSTILQMLSLTN